jgi:excisionase family DNA binding protein
MVRKLITLRPLPGSKAVLMDLKEAASFLGVSENTVRQLAIEGTLPRSTLTPTKTGRILFLRDELLQFEEQNREQ